MTSDLSERGGSRRDELLTIAEKICAESGPDALKLREVARRAGIAAPSMYNHFASLDALIAALIGQVLDRLTASYQEVRDLPPVEALRELCRAHVQIFCENPGAARILLADFAFPGGHGAIDKNEDKLMHLNRLDAELTSRGLAGGEFRELDLYEFTIARIGMTLTLLGTRWMTTPTLSKEGRDQLAKTVFDYSHRIVAR